MQLTDVERIAWAYHPVTLEFLQTLRGSRQETMEVWAKEGYTGRTLEETAVQNATALGGLRVLDQVIGNVEALHSVEMEAIIYQPKGEEA